MVPRSPCHRRLCWALAAPRGLPPEWQARASIVVMEDFLTSDMPPEEAENLIEFDYEGLQLTEHQKVMFMPVETRIRNVEYPEVIRKRVGAKKSANRENKWGQKFKQMFCARGRAKWSAALAKHGAETVKQALDLEPKTKDTAATKRKPTEEEILDIVDILGHGGLLFGQFDEVLAHCLPDLLEYGAYLVVGLVFLSIFLCLSTSLYLSYPTVCFNLGEFSYLDMCSSIDVCQALNLGPILDMFLHSTPKQHIFDRFDPPNSPFRSDSVFRH